MIQWQWCQLPVESSKWTIFGTLVYGLPFRGWTAFPVGKEAHKLLQISQETNPHTLLQTLATTTNKKKKKKRKRKRN